MNVIKKITLIAITLLLIVFAIAFGGTLLYEKEITKVALENFNKNLKKPIQTSEVNFSILKKFPFASIELNNLIILDVTQKDTLLTAEKFYLKLNIIDLFKKVYNFKLIEIKNGSLNIILDKNGKENYLIFEGKSEKNNFDLQKIIIENTSIIYQNKLEKIRFKTYSKNTKLKGDFTNDLDLIIKGSLVNSIVFFNDNQTSINTNHIVNFLVKNKESLLKLTGFISENDLKINFDADISNQFNYKVNLNGSALNIAKALNYISKKQKDNLKNYFLDGYCDLNLSLNKIEKNKTAYKADFIINEGILNNGKNLTVKKIKATGSYVSNLNNNFKHTINTNEIECLINNNIVKGSFKLPDLKTDNISANFSSILNLNTFKKLNNFKDFSGTAKISGTYFGGYKVFNNSWRKKISNSKTSLKISLLNTEIKFLNNIQANNINALFHLEDNFLNIDSISAQIGDETKVKFIGGIENIFKNQQKIAGQLFCEKLEGNDFQKSNNSNKNFKIPKNISANISLKINNASINRFQMSDFESSFILNKGEVKLKDIKLKSMSGVASGEITFNQTPSLNWRLITTANLNSIDVRQLFYEFENFGQNTMKHNHIRGTTNSEVYIRTEWDSSFNMISDNIYAFLDVKIIDGELIEFEPMMQLSEYISLEELKRIRFSTLQNQLEIKNRIIEIPHMKIFSSAMDVEGSGTHTFDNEIDYQIEFSLKDVLNKKFRKKRSSKISEFGYIEENEISGAILPLKMNGNAKNPEISFNFNRVKDRIKNSMKKQKNDIKDLFNKEKNSSKELDKTPDYNNIIEWEEDDNLL